jgi:hypothetical protein
MKIIDFIQPHKTKLVKTAIAITILVILLIIGLLLLQINFLIGEEIRVSVNPEYSTIQTTSPSLLEFSTSVTIYNKFVCSAECSYTLADLSHDTILDNGTFNSKAYNNKRYTKNIQLADYGYGRNLYSYTIKCGNIPTTLCPSSNITVVRESLMIVEYSPSKEQISALTELRKSYDNISIALSSSWKNIDYAINVTKEFNDIKFDTNKLYSLKSTLDYVKTDFNDVLNVWRSDNYILAKDSLSTKILVARSNMLFDDSKKQISEIISIINKYNFVITQLSYVNNDIVLYPSLYSKSYLLNDSVVENQMFNTVKDVNILITGFNSNGYDNYDVVLSQISDINKEVISTNNKIVSDYPLLKKYYPSLYVYSGITCMLNNTNCDRKYTSVPLNITDMNLILDTLCSDSKSILNTPPINSNTTGLDSEESLLFEYYLLNDYKSKYADNDNINLVTAYQENISNTLFLAYNITINQKSLNNYKFNKAQFSFYNNDVVLRDVVKLYNLCNADVSRNNFVSVVKLSKSYKYMPNISTTEFNVVIPEQPISAEKCCIYGECLSCKNNNNNSKNPLILLHGHSFNKDDTAYQSIEIFNFYAHNFSSSKEYYFGGTLVRNTNSTLGPEILGGYNVPVLVKPTYYIDTYSDILGLKSSESKNGNIDTYALRLKDIIDYTLYTTGASKVDIVAHSMGGIVVRRYVHIFGNQHIGKVILIATPNSGIDDHSYIICKIFGAINECDDMKSDSLFLKKLNDPINQQKIQELYLVIGRGCDTNGVDGDGVVTVNSSLISGVSSSNILFVNGSCTTTTPLHNALLNPGLYPEALSYVREVLSK